MDQLSVIYIIIFCTVLLAVQGAYWTYAQQKHTRDAVNRRLILAAQKRSGVEVLESLKRERGLIGTESGMLGSFNQLLIQTGLKLDQNLLALSAFSLGVAFFAAFGLVLDYGLLSFIFAVSFAIGSIFLFLFICRRKRIARFSEQLPDALDVIVRGVRSGYPFPVALNLVAKEMSDPIGSEFGMTSDEINFGSGTSAALDSLHRRVGHEDLPYLIMAIKIQNETGGNLAEILSRLARLLRERAMLRLKVKSITAEGRLSALYLSAMPFVLFGVITLLQRDYYTSVASHPVILPVTILGLVMLIIGNFIMYRMVNFKI